MDPKSKQSNPIGKKIFPLFGLTFLLLGEYVKYPHTYLQHDIDCSTETLFYKTRVICLSAMLAINHVTESSYP